MNWIGRIFQSSLAERVWSFLVLITAGFVISIGFQNCAPPDLNDYDSTESASSRCRTGDPGCATTTTGSSTYTGGVRICSLVPSTTMVAGGQSFNFRFAASPALPGGYTPYTYKWYGTDTSSTPNVLNGANFDQNLSSTSPPIWEFKNPGILGDVAIQFTRYMIVFDSDGQQICDTRGISPATNPTYAQLSLLNATCNIRVEPNCSYIPVYPAPKAPAECNVQKMKLVVELPANQTALPVDVKADMIDVNNLVPTSDITSALMERTDTKATFGFSREGTWSTFVTKAYKRKIKLKTAAGVTICTTPEVNYVLQETN